MPISPQLKLKKHSISRNFQLMDLEYNQDLEHFIFFVELEM